jgi:FKBP-type peptidyl-prolyl cis-trans isomerase (trigger factor)
MKYDNIKVNTLDKSEVEITGAIPAEALATYRKKALKEIGESVNIPGFRKGHIPEKVLVDKVGEVAVLEEAAEIAMKDVAPEIIEKNVPNYIGRPRLSITKIAPGNVLEFKINVDVMPEVKLPDYKKIAQAEMSKKDEKIEVAEKDIVDVIAEVRKQRAHHAYHLEHKDDTEHKHTEDEIEKHMPEFNDEFVKTVGNFENVEDFKTKAKESILKEKEQRAKEKKRQELMEKLVAETDLKLPESIINNEIERMFAQFESDIKGIGLKVEDYLKHINKKPEDLIKEWRPDAEKRAKLNIILEEIAKAEKIEPEEAKVTEQVEHLTKHYKDIDPVRARVYTEHMLRMEGAIKFLEEQK